MSTPDEGAFLHDAESMFGALHHEVEADLGMMTANEPDPGLPVSEWLVDPTEVERDEVALRSLLGAVEALEGDVRRPEPVEE
ncbi:hypothetical protein [Kribbella sp. NPDC051770]|uniref:hypothetical protein n=1 Tax=Kribbella sp. NPDC051770 TaxID=3155413 RepID=UPI00343DB766